MKTHIGAAVLSLILGWSIASEAAAAVTFVRDTYTLSGDSMGGAQASGSYGVTYYSNGKDYLFGDLTVDEEFVGGPSYTYSFNYNCLSTTPNCGVVVDDSQIPGLGSVAVALNIDSYAFNYPSSIVPTSFQDGIYDYSGQGTLTETIAMGAAPEAGAWVLLLFGIGATGAALRAKRRSGGAVFA
jgi:hypothetical protein